MPDTVNILSPGGMCREMKNNRGRLKARLANCVDTLREIRPFLSTTIGEEIFEEDFESLERIWERFDVEKENFSEEDVTRIEVLVNIFFSEIEMGLSKLKGLSVVYRRGK